MEKRSSEEIDAILLLKEALRQKVGMETVTENISPHRIRLSCRLDQQRMNFWLPVMNKLLFNGPGWTADISKHYFNIDEVTRFSWRLIFQVTDPEKFQIVDCVETIVHIVMNAPTPQRVELQSQRLAGVRKADRGVPNARGKGAAPTGKALVGPMAVQRFRG